MCEPAIFVDEIAVVDGLVVIRDGKLTKDAEHSPYMQAIMRDKHQGET